MSRKANVVIAALLCVLLALLAVFFLTKSSSISGFATYDPDNLICHTNLDSCIDLNGDGVVNYTDETIFSYLIQGNTSFNSDGSFGRYDNGTPYEPAHFAHLADFDNDSHVTETIDFQRCYVPMRDEARDKGFDNHITCNHDWKDSCNFGCPDLNGDGFVDDYDKQIILSSDVWANTSFRQTYPMADMNNDSKVDWIDRFCMARYNNKYVLCNIPRYFNHSNLAACADLVNVSTDLGNDGFFTFLFLQLNAMLG